MNQIISVRMAMIAFFFAPFLYAPQPVQAMTAEEFVKLFGVVDRYLQDIQKTFPTEPAPQAIPQPNPDISQQPTEAEPIQQFN